LDNFHHSPSFFSLPKSTAARQQEEKQKPKVSQYLRITPQENKTAIKKPNCKGKEKHKKPKVTQSLKLSQIAPTVEPTYVGEGLYQ
jgi:hypothetical protein